MQCNIVSCQSMTSLSILPAFSACTHLFNDNHTAFPSLPLTTRTKTPPPHASDFLRFVPGQWQPRCLTKCDHTRPNPKTCQRCRYTCIHAKSRSQDTCTSMIAASMVALAVELQMASDCCESSRAVIPSFSSSSSPPPPPSTMWAIIRLILKFLFVSSASTSPPKMMPAPCLPNKALLRSQLARAWAKLKHSQGRRRSGSRSQFSRWSHTAPSVPRDGPDAKLSQPVHWYKGRFADSSYPLTHHVTMHAHTCTIVGGGISSRG